MRYLVPEAVRARPGTSGMTARLTELLFIEMLRLQMAQFSVEHVGWLAALNDRYTYRALNLFHSRPADRWTVETLAREVGLSRSALVRRFGRMLNMSPIRYLATCAFHLAAQALREDSNPIAAIADEVGYELEEGFSRGHDAAVGALTIGGNPKFAVLPLKADFPARADRDRYGPGCNRKAACGFADEQAPVSSS